MPEYECYPIWISEDGGIFENIDPEELRISKKLKLKILEWDTKYEKSYDKKKPINSGFKNNKTEFNFEKEGLEIWKDMCNELRGEVILYRSILNGKEFVSSDLKKIG